MPSREIINRVKRNTPIHAAVPVFAVDSRRWPSISLLIFLAVRHMCTVSVATDTAAARASTPSQSAWLAACWNKYAAPTLSNTDRPMPQCTAGINSRRPLLRKYARLMAMIRNASRPSRRVMTNACNIRSGPLS